MVDFYQLDLTVIQDLRKLSGDSDLRDPFHLPNFVSISSGCQIYLPSPKYLQDSDFIKLLQCRS